MQYELDNPSDPYTFVADCLEVAALTVFLISTRYGARPQSGEEYVPIFFFGGADEWYKETFGRTPNEGMEALEPEVSAALASFMLGHFEDRRRYEAALNAITNEDKRKAFIDEWQDGRSSLNNIGGYAHRLAAAINKKICGARTGAPKADNWVDIAGYAACGGEIEEETV